MKKLLFGFLWTCLVLNTTNCALLGSAYLENPEVEVTGVALESFTAKDMVVRLQMNIKNPNKVPLKVGKVTYALSFSGEEVTTGEVKEGLHVPANGENSVEVPVKFAYNALGTVLSGLFSQKLKRDYEIKGTARVGLFSIPFSKKGEIELEQ